MKTRTGRRAVDRSIDNPFVGPYEMMLGHDRRHKVS